MTAYEIAQRILRRIDDDPAAPLSVAPDPNNPVPLEILAAINEGQELAAMLTLCLETTVDFTLAANTTFYGLRTLLPDYLVPLRITVGGARLRPATLAELDMLDDSWQARAAAPSRYLAMGFGFFGVTGQPSIDTAARFTYARSPVQLLADDFPEIPEANHQSLVDYGCYRVRLKEGAQGLARGAKYLNRFLDQMTVLGNFVRAKSRAARYDTMPFELALYDRSRLVSAINAKATTK